MKSNIKITRTAIPKAFSDGCKWIGEDALSPVCYYMTHKGEHSNVWEFS